VNWGTFRLHLFFIRFAVLDYVSRRKYLFSAFYIFSSIQLAELNYVSENIFKSVGVFVHFIYLIIRSKFKFLWFQLVCDWLQNWGELLRVNRAMVFLHLFFSQFFVKKTCLSKFSNMLLFLLIILCLFTNAVDGCRLSFVFYAVMQRNVTLISD
jgi:hypothetical protein